MIQVDIDGHPPIPFGLAPSILVAFHIQHNLLFLGGFRVLHSCSRFEALMIQMDIGGHPLIPFGPAPSILPFFHFQQLTIFSRFSGPTLPEPFWGLNDLGGYWWPPTYSTWGPTIFSFSFSVSAQLTTFSIFRVLNFRSHFKALNDVFWALHLQ